MYSAVPEKAYGDLRWYESAISLVDFFFASVMLRLKNENAEKLLAF